MRKYSIKNVDVFTTTPFSGYPTSVITSAEGLSDQEMQKIAEEISLTEVVYITSTYGGKSQFRIRFFTQSEEINISGHSMIGGCFALLEEGKIEPNEGRTKIYLETNDGDIPVNLFFRRGEFSGGGKKLNTGVLEKIMIRQKLKSHNLSPVDPAEIANILEIDLNSIVSTGFPIEEINTGLHHLVVPVNDLETIHNIKPDLIKMSIMNRKYGIQITDIFSLDTDDESTAHTRHFGPVVGILEASGSGMSAVGIGSYLTRHGLTAGKTMVFRQGNDLENLSKVYCYIDPADKDSMSVYVGGMATTSIERFVEIDETSGDLVFS
ncbi:MAG: PhzF family phenazine biosynthesis protein [Candidatus Krumholzibacteriales bacterium]